MGLRTLIWISVGAVALAAYDADAMVSLKQLEAADKKGVELSFDGKLTPAQVHVDAFNDILQLSLSDVAVYPAKITTLPEGPVAKVFAYQYAPRLVRLRLSVRGKAEDFKSRLRISHAQGGRKLSLQIAPEGGAEANRDTKSDQVRLHSAQAARAIAQPETGGGDINEQALLKKVLSDAPVPAPAPTSAAGASTNPSTLVSGSAPRGNAGLAGGGRGMPSPWSTLAKLAGVIALFLAMALAYKKIKGGSISKPSLSSLAGVAKALTRRGGNAPSIEILANHALGAKKSIAVVRVGGRTLVLGVTPDAISLITRLDSTAELEGNVAVSDWAEALAQESADPAPASSSAFEALMTQPEAGRQAQKISPESVRAAVAKPSARDRIRSRLEGAKQI